MIGGYRTARLRDAAVVMEVAVSLTLLISAGLLMHRFFALRDVNLGLQADHVFKTMLLLPPGSLQDGRTGEHIFPAGAGACQSDSRSNGCGGIELGATR